MKTISKLKVNNEDCNVKVSLRLNNGIYSGVNLKIDSASFNNNEDMLGLKIAKWGEPCPGGVMLGTHVNLDSYCPITTNNDHLCLKFDDDYFGINYNNQLTLKAARSAPNVIPLVCGTSVISDFRKVAGIGIKKNGGISYNEEGEIFIDSQNNSIKVTWDNNSDINNLRTAGVYDIYGERTNLNDNLPIFNSNPGHSIAARLTVVDSSLQKTYGSAPTEIHLTQFLMLDNRVGPSADMYMRTYTQDNGQTNDGSGSWSVWKKFQSISEYKLVTNDYAWESTNLALGSIDTASPGMNYMIDNGIYSGVYTDDMMLQSPSFIETFTLIVINNYAVVGQSNGQLKRTISQLKYAVDAITNQATVKQRTNIDNSGWTEWKDISGGGSNEVDITELLQNETLEGYGLVGAFKYGYIKKNVTYSIQFRYNFTSNTTTLPLLDRSDKIRAHIISKRPDKSHGGKLFIKLINDGSTISGYLLEIDAYLYGYEPLSAPPTPGTYYKYIINPGNMTPANITDPWEISVSADMTTL